MGQHVACERRRPDRSRELHPWGDRSQEAGLPNPEIPPAVRPRVRKRVDGSGGTVHGYPREPRHGREIRPHGRGYPGLPTLRRRHCRSQLSRRPAPSQRRGLHAGILRRLLRHPVPLSDTAEDRRPHRRRTQRVDDASRTGFRPRHGSCNGSRPIIPRNSGSPMPPGSAPSVPATSCGGSGR